MRLEEGSKLTSVVKAFSWRAIGTLDTFVVSWFITGSPKLAGAISLLELLTKTLLYYLHERAWHRITRAEASDGYK